MDNPIQPPLILDVAFDESSQTFQVKAFDEINKVEFVVTMMTIEEACEHLKMMMINTFKASPFFKHGE